MIHEFVERMTAVLVRTLPHFLAPAESFEAGEPSRRFDAGEPSTSFDAVEPFLSCCGVDAKAPTREVESGKGRGDAFVDGNSSAG